MAEAIKEKSSIARARVGFSRYPSAITAARDPLSYFDWCACMIDFLKKGHSVLKRGFIDDILFYALCSSLILISTNYLKRKRRRSQVRISQ